MAVVAIDEHPTVLALTAWDEEGLRFYPDCAPPSDVDNTWRARKPRGPSLAESIARRAARRGA